MPKHVAMRLNQFIFLLGCVFVSCNNGPTQAEYESLLSKYEQSNKELEDIKNTPAKRLITAKRYEEEKDLESAEAEYRSIITLYPRSEEADLARAFIIKREEQLAAIKVEKERITNLGFKALKEETVVRENNLTLNFSDITIQSKWIFDRYDTRYVSRETKRGSKYLTATLSIKSEINEPQLPPILAYKLQDGVLNLIGPLKYEFNQWKSYGAYLGNYADFSNDFAHSETVTFSIGILIDEELSKSCPIFLLADKSNNCVYRSYDRLSSPNTSYLHNKCKFKQTLDLDEALNSYSTIKIFNMDNI